MKTVNRATWLIVAALALASGCKRKDAQFVTIGTGSVTGIYYPTGGAISQMINRKFEQYRIKATVESTSGSVYNVSRTGSTRRITGWPSGPTEARRPLCGRCFPFIPNPSRSWPPSQAASARWGT